ncbi:TPA: glycosyltransferase family 1 protein [Escherichia coli]|nr:glycosyltransferase family 1 protein [Escherichia coli]
MTNIMNKIAIIGTVGIPACYVGFESLVQNLIDNQSNDVSYTVFCSAKSYEIKQKFYKKAQLKYIPLKANGISSILYDVISLLRCLRVKYDAILILGVSGCLILPLFRLLSRTKVITNIDGLEWRRNKWGKFTKLFLKVSEKIAVKYSDVVIADNQAIGDYVKSEYNKDCVVIAYGGEHALIRDVVIPKKKSDYYLSLCRIEPENNVSMILETFSHLPYKLKFIGNWNNSDYGINLKCKYSKCENIEIIDPIYDIEQLFLLRSLCKAYIHGHSAGGTNPSLVEAMQFGMDIIAFDCKFNRYTTEEKAHYFSNSLGLKKIIDSLESDNVYGNGNHMSEIALRRYQWSAISKQYEMTYK